MVHSNEWPP